MSHACPPVLTRVADVRHLVGGIRSAHDPVILVPTMGSLHESHLSLVRLGVGLGRVVVSIFVNPSQFGPNEDYEQYPRDLERDLDLLAPLGASGVFAPEAATLYPPESRTWVEVAQLADGLCGAHRPGHFRGVTTVVAKLLQVVGPDVAVFGQKDAQQSLIIDRMVRDLNVPTHVVVGPTVRAEDGLALSSRNRYLSAAQRREALGVPRALAAGRDALARGERSVDRVEEIMRSELGELDVDYAGLLLVSTLERPARAEGRILLAVAASVGEARLIDNLSLAVSGDTVDDAPLLDTATPEAIANILARSGFSTGETPDHG